MECARCGFDNSATARFCGGCGRVLTRRCGSCGAEAGPTARFCQDCGASLPGQAAPAGGNADEGGADARGAARPDRTGAADRGLMQHVGSGSAAPGEDGAPLAAGAEAGRPAQGHAPDGATWDQRGAEVRQITVLFADIVDSTGLAHRLDPEDYRELLAGFRGGVRETLVEHGGHLAQFIGDGAAALFGYPVAFDMAACHAVACGLALTERIEEVNAALAHLGQTLAVRVSVNTGSVVVDRAGRAAEAGADFAPARAGAGDIFGEVPHIAERINRVAGPGEVVVTESTFELARNDFEFEDLGAHALRGLEEPIRVFRARGPSLAASRLPRADRALIGRDGELSLLIQAWEQSRAGDGQVLMIGGEAGVGKSALIRALLEHVGRTPHLLLAVAGSAIRQRSPFHAVRVALESVTGLDPGEDAGRRRERVERLLDEIGVDPERHLPALAQLLAFDVETPLGALPQHLRRAAIGSAIEVVAAIARDRPVVLLAEDLHWIDPSSLEFLARAAELTPRRRWLFAGTFRPDFDLDWQPSASSTTLILVRLGRGDAARLVEATAGKPVPPAVAAQIIERTDGVPLFIEELTKTVIESGLLVDRGARFELEGALPPPAIPASLQDSLMARLDRLASVKQVAQIAAAIGRRFPHSLLREVSGLMTEHLDAALDKLIATELIFRLGASSEPEFEFKHALVQDAAYHSLLRSARRGWHAKIARALERDFPHIVENEPEVFAHHLTEAGECDRGAEFWLRAGRAAVKRSANLEAIGHLEQALRCLGQLPASEARDRRELEVRIAIAVPLAGSRGYAHRSVREAYQRARELSAALGEERREFEITYGLVRSQMIAADYAEALENARRLGQLAARSGLPIHRAAAARSVGATLFYVGRLDAAAAALAEIAATPLGERERREALAYDVVDLHVAHAAYSAWIDFLTGRADRARARSLEAVAEADATDHLFSRAFARAFATWTFEFCGDSGEGGTHAAALVRLVEDNAFSFWGGWAEVMSAVADGGVDAATRIETGLAEWRETGSRLGLVYFLWLEARALFDAGRRERAASVLAEARRAVESTGERWWEPEIHRLGARIEAPSGGSGDAGSLVDALERARKTARDIGAVALELRAVSDLAERNGPRWRTELAALLERVTAGGETADTARAREILGRPNLTLVG